MIVVVFIIVIVVYYYSCILVFIIMIVVLSSPEQGVCCFSNCTFVDDNTFCRDEADCALAQMCKYPQQLHSFIQYMYSYHYQWNLSIVVTLGATKSGCC